MYKFAATILLSSAALAQDAQDIATAARSPLLLARYMGSHSVVDWETLWNALGTRDPELIYMPCGTLPDEPCSTQIVTVTNPDQAIVIIQGDMLRRNDIYLRYLQKENGEWRFAGAHRAFVHGEYPRRHEVMRLNGKPFIKISTDRTQIGVTLLQEVEEWFDLTQSGFDPVFSFTAQGGYHPFRFGVGRTVHARAFSSERLGTETIDLTLSVIFEGPGFEIPATFEGVYERPAGDKTFILRRAYSGTDPRSAMTTEDFDGHGGIDFADMPNERLLVYAFSGLKKIASGADNDPKEWLGVVLQHTGDTPEKRALLELLAKR